MGTIGINIYLIQNIYAGKFKRIEHAIHKVP